MDTGTILAIIGVVFINIAGIAIAFGKLHQNVKNLNDTLHNGIIEKLENCTMEIAKLNGLPGKVETACGEIAELKGTVNTFIEFYHGDHTKRR